jgi:hypothetical protein
MGVAEFDPAPSGPSEIDSRKFLEQTVADL